jgi:hypothetical protein
MTQDEKLMIGWVAKALDLLNEVDHLVSSEEWRRDVDALRVRYHNKVDMSSHS